MYYSLEVALRKGWQEGEREEGKEGEEGRESNLKNKKQIGGHVLILVQQAEMRLLPQQNTCLLSDMRLLVEPEDMSVVPVFG